MRKDKTKIVIPLHEFNDLLKALSKHDLNLASQKVKILESYDVQMREVVTLLEEFMTANQTIEKLQVDLRKSINTNVELQDEIETLKMQKKPNLNKNQQQIASMIQSITLISKGKFQQARNLKNSKQVQDIIKNQWEYHCLKRYSDRYRGPEKERIIEPLRRSEQFIHIKGLLTIQSQEINQIHEQYEEALKRVRQSCITETQWPLISRRNKSLIEEIGLRNSEIVRAKTFNEYTQMQQNSDLPDKTKLRPEASVQSCQKKSTLAIKTEELARKEEELLDSKTKLNLYLVQQLLEQVKGRNNNKKGKIYEGLTPEQIIEKVVTFLKSIRPQANPPGEGSPQQKLLSGSPESNSSAILFDRQSEQYDCNVRSKSIDSIQLLGIQDYIDKIELLEQVNNTLLEEKQQLNYKITQLQNLLQEKKAQIGQLESENQKSKNRKRSLNTKASKIISEVENEDKINQLQHFLKVTNISLSEIHAQPNIFMEQNNYLHKRNQELHLYIQRLKKGHCQQLTIKNSRIEQLQKILQNLRITLDQYSISETSLQMSKGPS